MAPLFQGLLLTYALPTHELYMIDRGEEEEEIHPEVAERIKKRGSKKKRERMLHHRAKGVFKRHNLLLLLKDGLLFPSGVVLMPVTHYRRTPRIPLVLELELYTRGILRGLSGDPQGISSNVTLA